jgi:hypothetical protein
MAHKILLRSILVDVSGKDHADTLRFWTTALLAEPRRGVKYPEYHVLEHAASRDRVLVQDVGDNASRMHFDIETDDVEAEVARLSEAGAEEVSRNRFRDPWPHGRHHHQEPIDYFVIMRDPAGLVFCVVPAESADFHDRAKQVD